MNNIFNDDNVNNSGETTLPDYENVRNIILWQFEELNNAIVNFRLCKVSEYKSYHSIVMKKYITFYTQINDKQKLSNLDEKLQTYLKKFYKEPKLIDRNSARVILDICRHLMNSYGIFNLEKNLDDYR